MTIIYKYLARYHEWLKDFFELQADKCNDNMGYWLEKYLKSLKGK